MEYVLRKIFEHVSHLMSFQLVFLFGRSPVMLQAISSVRCWNKILPAVISSLISSSRSSTSSGAIERHLFRLISSIILLMIWLRFFTPVSFAIVSVQQACSTSFSLSLSNCKHLFCNWGNDTSTSSVLAQFVPWSILGTFGPGRLHAPLLYCRDTGHLPHRTCRWELSLHRSWMVEQSLSCTPLQFPFLLSTLWLDTGFPFCRVQNSIVPALRQARASPIAFHYVDHSDISDRLIFVVSFITHLRNDNCHTLILSQIKIGFTRCVQNIS